MSRPDVLLTAPMNPSVAEQLKARYVLHRLWEQTDQGGFLAEVGPRIRGMATNTLFGKVGDALIARLPSLEIIANFGVGYDNIDTAAASRRRVVVTNTPGVLDEEVADLTVGLLLATLGSAPWRGVGTPILGRAKDDQAASAGRLMRGLSLNAPIVSSVI